MKKLVLALLALSTIQFTACKKVKNSVVPTTDSTQNVPTNTGDTSFIVSGVQDIRTSVFGTTYMNVNVRRTIGVEQKVTLSLTGIPDNVEEEITTPSGYTTFSTNIRFDAYFAKAGTYPLKLSASSPKTTKEFEINLIIDTLSKRECNQQIYSRARGPYQTRIDSATKDSVIYSNARLTYDGNSEQMYFYRMLLDDGPTSSDYYMSLNTGGLGDVKIDFDCDGGTFTIPEQTVTGRSFAGGALRTYTISGTGILDIKSRKISIKYTTTYDNGTSIEMNKYTNTTTFN